MHGFALGGKVELGILVFAVIESMDDFARDRVHKGEPLHTANGQPTTVRGEAHAV